MIDTACPHSAITSKHPRVIFKSRSIGWYGSVTPDIMIDSPTHDARPNSFRNSSGASRFAKILVSKSSPLDNPRYSCPGRA